MQNKTKMLRKLIFAVIFTVVLTVLLSGCGKDEISIDGKYVATFELEGGTLQTPTSSVKNKINYAYDPGTYVIDPIKISSEYKLTRLGYVFTGWYTDKNCDESTLWDFENTVISKEKLTLYAGWKKAMTFTFYYTDEETNELKELGSYVTSADQTLDTRKVSLTRDGYTLVNYFSDPECTTEWNFNQIHGGTDDNTDVRVYVSYMEGNWAFVNDLATLKSAISSGKSVYLEKNIDCEGAELFFDSFSGEFNGNNYTISNFTVKPIGSFNIYCSIFDTIQKAVIKDVSFANVTYDITGLDLEILSGVQFAALALTCDGEVTISNVNIDGVLKTNYEGELPTELVYDGDTVEITDCNVNITIDRVG